MNILFVSDFMLPIKVSNTSIPYLLKVGHKTAEISVLNSIKTKVKWQNNYVFTSFKSKTHPF